MRSLRAALPGYLVHATALGIGLCLGVGCASNPETLQAPPEVAPPVVDDAGTEESQATDEAEPTRELAPLSVVISEGDEETESLETLVAAARKERERRQAAAPPSIVITDDNLADHATGELTLVGGSGRSASEREDAGSRDGARSTGPDAPADPEQYWRRRVREARVDWKETVEEITHLEQRVSELRRRFYEEDDPFYRDTQIKPSWDRSLERLEEARDAAEERRIRVQEILEEGRRAGAYPGWLREGIELEPDADERSRSERPNEHEIREPTVVEPTEPGTR